MMDSDSIISLHSSCIYTFNHDRLHTRYIYIYLVIVCFGVFLCHHLLQAFESSHGFYKAFEVRDLEKA